MELTLWKLPNGTCTMEVKSLNLHHGSDLMEFTPWKLLSVTYTNGSYLVKGTPWKLPHGTYTIEVTSWNLHHGSYLVDLTRCKLPH